MRKLLALILFAVVAFVPSGATAKVRVTPSEAGPNNVLDAERYKPTKPAPRPHKRVSEADDPVHFNEWGGIPCATLPDGSTRCFGQPAVRVPTKPKVTPGQILTATRTIGLPSLKINIQPGTATLINFDTIFYARTRPFARSVTLLGYDIDLAATPVGYTWHHGDGTSHTTGEPGAPYPSKAVTYRYMQTAKHLSPSVDVTYRVRYRVDGGSWQTLSQTLTANGPAGDLEVKEAGAVLTSY